MRLDELWKRRRILEINLNALIKRRLSLFQDGALSHEDFEQATGVERDLITQINNIEKRLRRSQETSYPIVMQR